MLIALASTTTLPEPSTSFLLKAWPTSSRTLSRARARRTYRPCSSASPGSLTTTEPASSWVGSPHRSEQGACLTSLRRGGSSILTQ
ncbi:unnamed protein product [Symbiodinium necroappetens]|uniref:Uncharacterized protein n=1 Tax=Symbiodinium necroappetens TaxID=1628268 RepID=A0A812NW10_9DINO|nr:unnamed protein product [Symbiodinium necroappetens]